MLIGSSASPCALTAAALSGLPAAAVAFTGLTSNGTYANYAEIASQISLTANGAAPATLNWGTTPGGSEYGSALPFTVPATHDTGDRSNPAPLYYSGTAQDSTPFSGVLFIRAAPVTITTPAALTTEGPALGDTVTLTPAGFSGLPAAHTRTLTLFSPDETLALGDGSAVLTHTITPAEDNEVIDGTDTVETSAEVITSDATGEFTVDDFEAPAITTPPASSGVAEVGADETLTPGTVTGNPTPTRTWQKQRQLGGAGAWSDEGAPFSGDLYTKLSGDEGYALRFEEIETNALGVARGQFTAPTPVIQTAATPSTLYSRDYTAASGAEVPIDLATVHPENGATTYALQGAPAGVTLAGAALTIDTDTAQAGTITVRKTDADGDRDLVLSLTLTTLSLTVASGVAEVTFGADTDPAKVFSVPITGGPYDGETVTFTPADLTGLPPTRGFAALPPVITLTTDADAGGDLDSGDIVSRTRAGLWLYPGEQSAPTITTAWRDASADLGDSDDDFTGTGGEDSSVFIRETDGASTSDSATVPVDTGGGGGFTPASDGNLVSHYDMSDPASITHTGGVVSAVADQTAANGLTSAGNFLTGGTTLNGGNVLTHDGLAGDLHAATFTTPAGGNVAIHGVMQTGPSDNNNDGLVAMQGGTNYFNLVAQDTTGDFDGRLLPDTTGMGASVINLAGGPFNGWINFSIILDFTAGTIEVFIGGLSRGSTGDYNINPLNEVTDFRLLSNRNGTQRLPGAVAEVCVTTNTANRTDYHAYLAAKWGIS